MVSSAPSACTLYVTPHFLVQVEGEPRKQAVSDCRRPPVAASRRVRITRLTVDGNRARVTVHAIGGQMGGSVLGVDLIESRGRWKFDHLSTLRLNRSSFDASLRREMTRDGLNARRVKCTVARGRSSVTTGDIEHAMLSGQPSTEQRAYRRALLSCLDPQIIRLKLLQAVFRGLQESTLSRSVRDCITLRFARIGNRRLIHLVLAGRRLAYGVGRAAALDCISHPPVT